MTHHTLTFIRENSPIPSNEGGDAGLTFQIMEEIEEGEFQSLLNSNLELQKYSQEKELLRILLANHRAFYDLSRQVVRCPRDGQKFSFEAMTMKVNEIVFNFSNAAYVFSEHARSSVKRKFGRKSNETIEIDEILAQLRPFSSLFDAVRHQTVHSSFPNIQMELTSNDKGEEFSAVLDVLDLRKNIRENNPLNKTLMQFGEGIELNTALSEWMTRFESLLPKIFRLHAVHALKHLPPIIALLSKHSNVSAGRPALVTFPKLDKTEFDAKIHYIDQTSLDEVRDLCV